MKTYLFSYHLSEHLLFTKIFILNVANANSSVSTSFHTFPIIFFYQNKPPHKFLILYSMSSNYLIFSQSRYVGINRKITLKKFILKGNIIEVNACVMVDVKTRGEYKYKKIKKDLLYVLHPNYNYNFSKNIIKIT